MFGESQFYTPYEQDVPYGMSQDMPSPMGTMPSNMQGFPNYGSPFSNNSQNQIPSYKKGGRVKSTFKDALEYLRLSGEGRDKILAHISPEEAEELAMMHGGNINPISGLPQFGWWENLWDRVFEGGHNLSDRYLEPVSRTLATTLGSTIGGMAGGPMGSTIGGSLASAGFEGANAERPNIGGALLRGGIHGAAQGYLSPMIGNAFGAAPTGRMGTLLGMSPKHDLLGSLGAIGASKAGIGAKGATKAATSSGGGLKGLIGSLMGGSSEGGGGLLGGSLLDKALLGTAILGALNAKYETPKEKSAAEYMAQHGSAFGPEQQPREIRPYERSLRYFNPETYSPGFQPERLYFTGHGYDQPMRLAEGGHLFRGKGGGQDDTIPKDLPEGGYVIDASTMADLGDGNSEEGDKKLTIGLSALTKNKSHKKDNVSRRTIKAKVSAKERFISPEEVTALGNGNNDKGASMLEKMVKGVRKQKRSNPNKLPPKAKSIQEYMRGR